ncbi:hypothetical protein ACFOD0_17015 [Shewanella intestini]|uniref:DUF998 domain-containing protein n=1 Tax=Shewanella intestini TaxID=2017544 RepID=A0ABS5I648_9GAMM|nr:MULTISPECIES: hypothetical protein [Shewanella]MBR9729194.1 hypothetical protein [Shewanella intestini]MRG37235.1 hypothetical protein [Shewanella sp. XMDDZSB0408]
MSLLTAAICCIGFGTTLFIESNGFSVSTLNTRPDTFGNYLTSSFAIVFNLSLLSAGCCLILAMIAIFFTFPDMLSRYIAIAGATVGLSILLMGIFPINFIDWHRKISTLYLLSSFVLHVLCVPDFFKHNSTMSKTVVSLSAIGIVSTVSLMLQLDWKLLDFPPCDHMDNSFCTVSLSMWVLTHINILWCITLSLRMRTHIKQQQSVIMQSHWANL